MVLLHMIADTVEQADEIAEVLTEEKLVLSALIQPGGRMKTQGRAEAEDRTLILAQTKGLLFNAIDERLRKMYPEQMPVLYSVPIVNMDWEQADVLVAKTAKI